MAVCIACKQDLFPASYSSEDTQDYQLDGTLWVAFFGGYGMFLESREYQNPKLTHPITSDSATYEAPLCRDCANDLCDKVPWIAELIKHNS